MKQNSSYTYLIFIVIIFVLIIFILTNVDLSFYENYNRVISEPDSVEVIELDL